MDVLTVVAIFLFAVSLLFIFKAISIDFSLALRRKNRLLRAALAPILAHADNPDTAPPLRISVRQAREMKEKVNA